MAYKVLYLVNEDVKEEVDEAVAAAMVAKQKMVVKMPLQRSSATVTQ